MFRLLVSDTADLIAEFDRREDAIAALTAIIGDARESTDDFILLEFDDVTGDRVGVPVRVAG